MTSTESWAAVRAVVEAALDLPPAGRDGFLDEACGGDRVLRDHAASLVHACERAESAAGFLTGRAAERAGPLLAAMLPPDAAQGASAPAGVPEALRDALASRYRLERELGRGGMATVYLAQDRQHGRPVAVKVLTPELSALVSVERFLSEIRVTARLTHPHILPLHASGEEGSALYYVMPFVDGETLRARLAREGRLAPAAALRLVREVADALDYAHRLGVVHRDIKPENILFQDGHAIVADFGIARAVSRAQEDAEDSAEGAAGQTQPGTSPGTPAYMAPEQARDDATIDRRVDLYALGVVAYEALAGAHPFGTRTRESMIAAHRDQLPAPLAERCPDAPAALATLVMRLLAKDPAVRPSTGAAVLRALDDASLSGASARARRWPALAGIAALLALAAAGGYASIRGGASPTVAPTLRGTLAGPEAQGVAGRPPGDSAAQALYLRGRYLWRTTQLTREATLQAGRFYAEAIARDSGYAPAYAGLSEVHARLAIFGYGLPHEEFPVAKALARRAIALDSALAPAHTALGHTLFTYDYDWSEAERSFRRAIDLDDGYPFARILLALCVSSQGRFDEAIAQLDTARAADPMSPLVPNILGRVYVSARLPDLAIRELEAALELNPQLDMAHQQLGWAYLQEGMADEAIDAFRRAATLSGPRDSAHLAYAYATTGRRAEAERIMRTLVDSTGGRYVLPFHVAVAHAGLGDTDAAFQWLERSYEERGSFMNGVAVTPAFDALHSDPRWASLMRRMGLEGASRM